MNALELLSKFMIKCQKEAIREIVREELQKTNFQPVQKDEEKIYSIGEASTKAKLSESTIHRMIKSGELKSFRQGKKLIRIKESDLTAMMVERKIRGIK